MTYRGPDYSIDVRMLFVALLMGVAAGPVSANVIVGINHTGQAINYFSVDGRSAVDIIGPYRSGGGGCCYAVPAIWHPDMGVRIEWQTGSAYSEDFPGFADRPKFFAWKEKVEAQTRSLDKWVSVADYTNQQTCGITVHFLPCDDVQVTTSCHPYGSPGYPIKAPLRSPNPPSCPQKEH